MSGNPVWPPFFQPGRSDLASMVAGLSATERADPAELARGQRAQFAWLWAWCRRQVPWYGRGIYPATDLAALVDRPDSFAAALAELPLLAKATLREAPQALAPRSLAAVNKPLTTLQTSGSVGIPVSVNRTPLGNLIWQACTVRDHLWQRRDFRKRLGVIRYLEKGQRIPGGRRLPDWGRPVSQLYTTGPSSAVHIGEPVAKQADFLIQFDPHYLLTYPSVATALLDHLGPAGKPPALEQLRLMSEPVDPALRERLARDWGVGVADIYSANEVGYLALECEAGSLHVQAEALLVEILRDTGESCAEGETGRVVVTSLHNLGTPLIRYDIGDYATVGGTCPCGRTLPVLLEIRGRVRNLVRTPDGRRFWPTGLLRVRQVEAVTQAQYVQTGLDRVELRVVVTRPLTTEERDRLITVVRRVLDYPFAVTVVELAEIPRGPTGKFEEFMSLVA